jgi:hypothetical protein
MRCSDAFFAIYSERCGVLSKRSPDGPPGRANARPMTKLRDIRGFSFAFDPACRCAHAGYLLAPDVVLLVPDFVLAPVVVPDFVLAPVVVLDFMFSPVVAAL